MRAGIDVCLTVAGWRFREVRVLLGSAPHTAAILFSCGVEEFGKAALLNEAFTSGHDPVVIKGFYSHKLKLTAAGRYIAPSALRLSQGGFDPGAFDSAAFDAGQPANVDARFSSLYVGWDNGWRQGTHEIDEETVRQSIESVENVMLEKRNSWTS